MVWLYNCTDATLKALANHTDAFTAVSPSLYSVGSDASGDAILSGDGASCVQSIHTKLPGKEVWPWITSPDSTNATVEDALMRRLFASPEKFTARAKSQAAALGVTGYNVDFEAPGEFTNSNKTFWRETLKWADNFAGSVGVPVSLDVVCTANIIRRGARANVTCNASADAEMLAEMKSSKVHRFVSMGTYSDSLGSVLINQIDWFQRYLPMKWGLGACPTCEGPRTPEQLLLRFGVANAYGVREVDLFAFSASEAAPWQPYWPFMRAFLRCGQSTEAGYCWPNQE